MPRDKSVSHEKVKIAIREEFLEKGYEGASVRSIGLRAGMTSAGLYRHYADKEAMFDSLVEPLPAVESLRGLGARMSHEDRHRFYIDVAVQISLAERPATHAEVEFHIEILLDRLLDLANRVAGKIAVLALLRGKERM